MDTRKRALSALAGTGLAFVLGTGMAVAAGGVFMVPDHVLMEPSSSPTSWSDATRAEVNVSDAMDPGAAPSPSAIEPSPAPLPPRVNNPPAPLAALLAAPAPPVQAPLAKAPSPPPPAAEGGHDHDDRSARNGQRARSCHCDTRDQDDHYGHHRHNDCR